MVDKTNRQATESRFSLTHGLLDTGSLNDHTSEFLSGIWY